MCVLVKKQGTEITKDVFYENTDTYQYLEFHSPHPSHTKRNIPYKLIRQTCTIVDEEETALDPAMGFEEHFQFPRIQVDGKHKNTFFFNSKIKHFIIYLQIFWPLIS